MGKIDDELKRYREGFIAARGRNEGDVIPSFEAMVKNLEAERAEQATVISNRLNGVTDQIELIKKICLAGVG